MVTIATHNRSRGPDISFTSVSHEGQMERLCKVEDRLPCVFSFFNALQIVISQFLSIAWLPLQLSQAMCFLPADSVRVYLVSTALLTSGVVTYIQSTLGMRLPTLATPSVIYLSSLLSMLQQPDLQCPSNGDLYAMGPVLRTLEWQKRLREVQGALLFSGVLQTAFAFSGLQGWIFQSVSPVTVAPTVILAGVSIIYNPIVHLTDSWSIFSIVALVMVVFALWLRDVCLPLPTFSIRSGFSAKYFPAFRMFPVLWTCVAVYGILKAASYINSATSYPDSEVIGFQEAVDNSKWFFIPFPFEWGLPTLSMTTVIHMLPAIIMQSVISLLMTYGNANTCGVGSPPSSAIYRTMGIEGLGLMFGSLWGHGVTINLPNIGLMSLTGIVNRNSMQFAAVVMVGLSHFTRIISVLANIPIHFLTALYLFLHLSLGSLGITVLRFIRFSTPRDVFIVGFSLFVGFAIPVWVSNPDFIIDTGFQPMDVFLSQSFKCSVFVGAISGYILDILLPGRITSTKSHPWKFLSEEDKETYRLPTWEELLCSVLERSPFLTSN